MSKQLSGLVQWSCLSCVRLSQILSRATSRYINLAHDKKIPFRWQQNVHAIRSAAVWCDGINWSQQMKARGPTEQRRLLKTSPVLCVTLPSFGQTQNWWWAVGSGEWWWEWWWEWGGTGSRHLSYTDTLICIHIDFWVVYWLFSSLSDWLLEWKQQEW